MARFEVLINTNIQGTPKAKGAVVTTPGDLSDKQAEALINMNNPRLKLLGEEPPPKPKKMSTVTMGGLVGGGKD